MRLNRLERFLVRVTQWDAMALAATVLAVLVFTVLAGVWGVLGMLGSLADSTGTPKP